MQGCPIWREQPAIHGIADAVRSNLSLHHWIVMDVLPERLRKSESFLRSEPKALKKERLSPADGMGRI